MKVLLVGAGAREHALAMAIAGSPLCESLICAPGNPGMEELGTCLPVRLDDIEGISALAESNKVDLVVIGPEAPLAAGLADAVRGRGIACFGPSRNAARIESSKAFAKAFMKRHGIPTAEGESFAGSSAGHDAKVWARSFGKPVVVKASGLMAGKGVIVPRSLEETEEAIDQLLAAGGEIVLEERLEGEELSLIALCDGAAWAILPSARDHKRLMDGDRGPNTGGMGAYAPASSMQEAQTLAHKVIEPAVRGLAEEGMPFVGALYAGLMLTSDGPRVLEYNARFGDPETQVILPLFETDLLRSLDACARGNLKSFMPRFNDLYVVCVVLASEGYPHRPVSGREIVFGELPARTVCLHAGTVRQGSRLLTAGGRVLSMVGVGRSMKEARVAAYEGVQRVRCEGIQYRKDIGARASESAYVRSGVDIDAGNRAVELMKEAVRSTYGPEVIAGIGAFGGQFDASLLRSYRSPVLVASTDGVGTKTSLGLSLGRLRGLGMDIVNHSINDILVQGARPLFFMDYIAAAKLRPEAVAEVVSGMAESCRAAGCALLGGETAEMPGTYAPGEMDVAGTIVGLVERDRLLPRTDLQEGDLLIGLPSSGLHTNGYSLARAIAARFDLHAHRAELGESLADALLRPHRSYLDLLMPLLAMDSSPIKALAHITGGGFYENIPRVLPDILDACIVEGSWDMPPIFRFLQREGGIDAEEMRRVFNLGIGMVIIAAPQDLERVREAGPFPVIGRLEKGAGKVRFV